MQDKSTGELVAFDICEDAEQIRASRPDEFGPILHTGMKVSVCPKGSNKACTFVIHNIGRTFVNLRPISLAVFEK